MPPHRQEQQDRIQLREHVPAPPTGWDKLRWYGPGLLWMLSSVGSGSVLFTPRVGSRYGYELLWAALLVILTEWIIIREVGRYTVVTGRTILHGFRDVPGPRGWAVWAIFVPQLVAAVVTIAGIAALAGSALMIALPGSQGLYATALVLASIALVVTGRYKGVERISSIMAALLVLAAVTTAVLVFSAPGELATGIVPAISGDFDFYFILPWLGFILSGAAGVMWYSYWVAERGYGGEVEETDEGASIDRGDEAENSDRRDGSVSPVRGPEANAGPSPQSRQERIDRLGKWMRVMSTTALIGVGGGALVVVSFLILGAEVLRPEGIVPEGIQVAEQLTRLLSEVWGAWGYWLLLIGIVVALGGTILADQDGWGRTFADATLLLWRGRRAQPRKGQNWIRGLLAHRERLKNAYAIVFTAAIPLLVFWAVREPVAILSIGGIIAAAHTPVIVFLTQYLNKTRLPREMRPGWLMSTAMIASGLFFLVFAVLYLLDLAK